MSTERVDTSFGTQSPPLEATGQEQPMGVSSIDGGKPDAVPDAQQREQYFQGNQGDTRKQSKDQAGTGVSSGKAKQD
ncbi:hypothetical protein B0H21DRAFT_579386 [Amylocystis lapponica]|nr:hypothetical protein B0H21DRAFT_579386 [Amylocystis lapponica]